MGLSIDGSGPGGMRLTRRGFMSGMGAVGAGALLPAGLWGCAQPHAAAVQGAGSDAPPDVLILQTDDQTFHSIRMLGNAQVRTPNLDALAARGTTMSHCFNQGGWHGAICMASRAMMATGRGLYRVTDPHDPRAAGHLQTDTPLWAEHFRQSGYKTFGTGKWHNGGDAFRRCFSHGDAVFLGGMHNYGREDRRNDRAQPIPTGHWLPELKHYDGDAFTNYTPEEWSTDSFANAAIAFLNEQSDSAEPLYTYASFTAPHDPHHAPPEYMAMYPAGEVELPPNFMREHPFDQGDARVRDEVLLDIPRDPDAVKRQLAAYYAMITHIDARIGDILAALDATGRADRTLVVFTADHGLAVGQHGLLGKQNMYDHSVRVPMIFAGPGIPPGEISDELVYLHALYATTCELAGLDIPDAVTEPSLAPILGGVGTGYDSIFCGYRDLQRMARTKTHKLIRYPHNSEVQLFDMANDPWEVNDLAEDPAHADKVRELDAMLRAWQVELGDTLALEPLG